MYCSVTYQLKLMDRSAGDKSENVVCVCRKRVIYLYFYYATPVIFLVP